MAFFVEDDHSYFSLSLDPAGSAEARVFRLTARQVRVARSALPFCMAVSAAACGLAVLLAVGSGAGFAAERLGSGAEVGLACLLGLVGAAAAGAEFVWFLWVYYGRRSMLDERERRSLRVPRIVRRPSLAAYWTFLLAMAVPIVGMATVAAADPGSMREVLANPLLIAPLLLGTAVLAVAVVRRIAAIRRAGRSR